MISRLAWQLDYLIARRLGVAPDAIHVGIDYSANKDDVSFIAEFGDGTKVASDRYGGTKIESLELEEIASRVAANLQRFTERESWPAK